MRLKHNCINSLWLKKILRHLCSWFSCRFILYGFWLEAWNFYSLENEIRRDETYLCTGQIRMQVDLWNGKFLMQAWRKGRLGRKTLPTFECPLSLLTVLRGHHSRVVRLFISVLIKKNMSPDSNLCETRRPSKILISYLLFHRFFDLINRLQKWLFPLSCIRV